MGRPVAAMRCPTGWPTSRSAWRRSERPGKRLRPRLRPRRERKPRSSVWPRKSTKPKIASDQGGVLACPRMSPPPRRTNFTDPDSRVLLTKDGFIQGYNAQAAVDGADQIIVAHGLTQSMSDCPQLVPLIDGVHANLGRKPNEVSADAGYCSEDNLSALASRKIRAYVATGRAKRPAEITRKGRRGSHAENATKAEAHRPSQQINVSRSRSSSRCSGR